MRMMRLRFGQKVKKMYGMKQEHQLGSATFYNVVIKKDSVKSLSPEDTTFFLCFYSCR